MTREGFTRDEPMGLEYRSPKTFATCAWCGRSIGERRSVPHDFSSLSYCSARCSAERAEHLHRMRRTTPLPDARGWP